MEEIELGCIEYCSPLDTTIAAVGDGVYKLEFTAGDYKYSFPAAVVGAGPVVFATTGIPQQRRITANVVSPAGAVIGVVVFEIQFRGGLWS